MKNSRFFKSFMLMLLIAASQSTFAQTTIISAAGDGGFETGSTMALNNWTVVNGAQTNQWALGTAAAGYTGSRAAYISNNGGTSNAITNSTSVVHFYRNVTFPAGQTTITLSFDFKQATLDQTFDYMQVFLVPTTTTPVAGTELTSGQIGNSEYPGASALASFTNFTITIAAANAGTTKRLVFSWHNDAANPKGAGAIDNISLTSCAPITITPSSNTPVCAGNNLNLTATSTAATFSWSGPNGFSSSSQNPTIAGATTAATGTYTVVASNGICSNSATTSVTVNAATSISTQPSNQTACETANASFVVTAAGGSLTYQWQDNSSGSFANIGGATAATLSLSGVTLAMNARQYKCIVSGTCGSVTSSTVSLTVNTKPVGVASVTSQSTCSGTALTGITFSTSNGVVGTTYSWTRNNTATTTGIAASGSTNPVTGSLTNTTTSPVTSTFTIIPTSPAGCAGASFTSAATVNPNTTITTQPAAQTNCEGTNASYSVTATGTSLTYQWQDNSSGSFADIGGATAASLTVNGVTVAMSGRLYRCIVTGTCGVLNSNSAALTVNAVPTASISPGTTNVCGTSQLLTSSSSASSPTYQWKLNGTNISGATNATYNVTGSANGSYTVAITKTGCSSTSAATALTFYALPAGAAVSPASSSVCNGVNRLLASLPQPASNLTPVSENFNGASPTITVVNGSGNTAACAWTSRTSPYVYSAVTYNSGDNKFMMANSDAGGSGGTTNTTLVSANFSTVGYNTLSLSFKQYFRSYATDVTVAVEVSTNNGSTWTSAASYIGADQGSPAAFATSTVNLNAYINQPNFKFRFNYVTFFGWYWCIDNAVLTGTPSVYQYSWAANTGSGINGLPAGAGSYSSANDSITVNASGTTNYTMSVMDMSTGCVSTAASALTVNPLPNVTITPGGATAFCAGGGVTLTAPAGLSSYSWNTAPVQTTQSIVVHTAASYTVVGTNSNGCSNNATQAITVYDTIPASIVVIGSTNLCTGQTTTDLQASQANAVSYLWSNADPNSLITVATAGNYSVTATDNHGCLHHKSQAITQTAPPVAPVVVPLSSTVLCSDGITATSVVLHTTNYSSNLLWSTSEATQDITVDYADIFNVTYTDANGCFSSSNSVTTVVKLYSTDPTAAVTNAANNSICAGSGTTLSVQGGTLGDDAVWTWHVGSCSGATLGTGSSLVVNPSATTTYFVRAEGPCNTTNCAQVTVVIKTNSVDPSTASPSAPILCGSGNSNLSVSGGSLGTGATWVWYAGGCGNGASIGTGTTLAVSPSSTTTYYVRAEGDCNITNCTQATVVVKTLSVDPTTASPSAPILCGSGNSNLSVSGGSLGTGANWVWYEGGCGNGASIGTGTTLSVSPSSTSTYYVRAEGDCNITNCTQATVTVKTLSVDPTTASPSAPILCGSGNSNLSVGGGTLGTGANWVWYAGGCGTGASIGTGASLSVSPSVTTVYYVRAEGDCNITNCTQATVVVKTLSVDPTTASPSAPILCGSGNSNLSVSGGSLGTGANWVWYAGGCGTGASIGTGTTLAVSPASTTTYFVRAEGDCNITNCSQATVTVKTLSVDPTTASPSAPILCGSGNSNLSVSGGSLGTGANWVWYAGGCGNGVSIGTGTTLNVAPSLTTTYYVRAEGDCNITNCTQATVTVKSFSVDPTLATNNATYNEICIGSPVQLTVNGGSLGSDANWVWYEGNCASGAPVATGASVSVTPSAGGNHIYFVRAEGYCNNTNCVNKNVLVRTSGPTSTVATVTAPVSACTGNSGTISVNMVSNATYYSWSGPSGVLFNGNAGPYQTLSTNVTATFSSLPGGSSGYSMCVFAGNACGQSNTKCNWVRGTVSVPAAITGSSTGCPNTSYTYSVPVVAGADLYTWFVTGNDASLNGTGLTSVTSSSPTVAVDFAAPFVGATLNVYASLSCGYNSAARSMSIVRNPAIPGAISGVSYVCPNGSTNYSVPSSSGASSYNWTCSVPGTIITPSGASASLLFPATVPAGSTVCVSAVSGCGYASAQRCKGIASGLPNVPANISGPASGQCGATGVSFTIPPVSSATIYQWSVSNGNATIVGPSNLSGVTIDFSGSLSSVQLSVSAGNNCGLGGTRSLAISGSPITPASISGNNSVCNGSVESYTTSGSAGASSFTWQVPAGAMILGGQGSGNILVLWGGTSGNVRVTASNSCGNSGTRTFPVSITCRESQMQNTLQSEVKVFPNPAHDKMKVEIGALTSDRVNIQLINAIGEVVYTSEMNLQEGTNMMELNLENVAKGFYQLSVKGNSINTQHRVVVQ